MFMICIYSCYSYYYCC